MRLNAFLRSTELTIVFTTILTITAEFVPVIKQTLASLFYHHWIGKSVVSIIFFGLCLLILEEIKTSNKPIAPYRTSVVTIGASIILTAFFIAEFLGVF